MPAEAAYRIYLKNGSVIKGVKSYKKTDGTVRLTFPGGTAEFPESDIEKIEKGDNIIEEQLKTEELQKTTKEKEPPKAKGPDVEKTIQGLKQKIEKIEGEFLELKRQESEAEKLRAEFDEVTQRLDFLFRKGRAAAINAGKGEPNWFLFLTPQEQEWSKLNLLRQNELKTLLAESEKDIEEIARKREYLLNEKGSIENQIRSVTEHGPPK